MRQELTFLRQTHRVQRVRLKQHNRQVRHQRHNHQRQEEMVAAGQLGNKEDTRQRRVHHARHQTCHAYQSEVGLRHTDARQVNQPRHDKARQTADEERGREDTSHSAAAVGRHRSDNLYQHNQREIEQHHPGREAQLGQRRMGQVGYRVAVEQTDNHFIALTVQRREDENQH